MKRPRDSLVALAAPTSESRGTLFCLHHAGGGAAGFRGWPERVGAEIQIGTVVLPGREGLFAQPPFTDFALAVERIANDIDRVVDKPYALFGHSLGAMLAFEVTCRLERTGRRPPSCLVVSGRRALHLTGADTDAGADDDNDEDNRPVSDLSDSELDALLRKMGGTSPLILQSDEMMRMFLPVVRADFGLVENYRWNGESRASCPILALGGESDRYTTRDNLLQGGAVTSGRVAARTFQGGHFFVASHEAEVCSAVAAFARERFAGAAQ